VVLFPVWPSGLGWARRATGNGAALGSATRGGLLLGPLTLLLLLLPLPLLLAPAAGERLSSLQLNQETNAYTGLTFAFDPRLAQLETNGSELAAAEIQFSRWLDIMQRSSALLYESLAGRAYLAEVRVLLPYRWLAKEWPLVQKPAGLTAWNRRLRYASADVLVGFEGKLDCLRLAQGERERRAESRELSFEAPRRPSLVPIGSGFSAKFRLGARRALRPDVCMGEARLAAGSWRDEASGEERRVAQSAAASRIIEPQHERRPKQQRQQVPPLTWPQKLAPNNDRRSRRAYQTQTLVGAANINNQQS